MRYCGTRLLSRDWPLSHGASGEIEESFPSRYFRGGGVRSLHLKSHFLSVRFPAALREALSSGCRRLVSVDRIASCTSSWPQPLTRQSGLTMGGAGIKILVSLRLCSAISQLRRVLRRFSRSADSLDCECLPAHEQHADKAVRAPFAPLLLGVFALIGGLGFQTGMRENRAFCVRLTHLVGGLVQFPP